MISFLTELNNREIAIAIWVGLFLLFVLLHKGMRRPFFGVVKIFFSIKIQTLFLSLCLYAVIIIWSLHLLKVWDFMLLKDTVFWFFGVAFLLIFRVTKKADKGFFREIIKDSWKWTILIEFISNLYVFSLPMESFLTLTIILFSAMKPIAEGEAKYKDVNNCLGKSINILAIATVLFSLYRTIEHYKEFFSWENLQSILLSPILTVLYMPFLYALDVMVQYETLFIRLKYMSRGEVEFYRFLKKQVFKTAKFNLSKINNIAASILKADIYTVENIPGYLNAISKRSKKTF